MKRILVVVTRQIGDVLLTTPLIRAARQRWPQARIEVAAFAGTLPVLEGNPDIDACIPMAPRLGFAGTLRLAARLRRGYDLALVADPGDRAHVIGWLAARERAGLVSAEGRGHGWKAARLRHAVPLDGDRGTVHVVTERLHLLDPWIEGHVPLETPQVVPPAALPLPAHLADSLQHGHVVVHAPSMWRYKQWPVASFETLVRGLLAAGRQVVLTGSGSERDQSCIAPLREAGKAPQMLDTSGQLGFGQLATLLAGCALYIGPDTSVTHLAAACGAPTLALFGPTNPQRWGPWPARASAPVRFQRHAGRQEVGSITLLQGAQDCVPCGRAGCEDHHHSRSACLESIAPESVLRIALERLGQRAAMPAASAATVALTRKALRRSATLAPKL